MKRRAAQVGLALALAAAGFGLARATPLVMVGGRVERGKYLVSAIGCGACHTPKTMTPMPWGAFRNFSDEDLRSIYAYLKTVAPIHNRVPEPLPPPGPTGILRGRS